MRALFVAGHRSEKVWSELAVYPLNQGMKLELLGDKFVWIVFITVKGVTASQDIGTNLLNKVDEEFGQLGEPLKAEEFLDWWQAIRMSLGDDLVVTTAQLSGDGKVILISNNGHTLLAARGNRVGYLMQPKGADYQVLEGTYEWGDKWFWGTDELLEVLSAQRLAEELGKGNGSEIQASVMSLLQVGGHGGVAGAVIDFIRQEELALGEPPEPVETKPAVFLKEQPFKRRRLMVLGLLILIMVVGGGWMGGKRRTTLAEKEKYNTAVTQANEQIKQAQELAQGENKASAAAILKEVEAKLGRVKTELGENQKLSQGLEDKIAEVKQAYIELSGEQEVAVDQAWYDLTLIKDGLYGIKMDQTEEKMDILDGTGGMVVTLGFDKKDAGLTGSGELLKGATLIATVGKRAAVYVPSRGVMEINTTQKTTGNLIAPDTAWQRMVGLALFSGNLYMVDAGASDIYIYPGLTSGVGDKKRWLKPGQEPDLTKVVDVAIDGDLWTLDESGKIRRFRQGEQIDYVIKNLEKPLGKSVALVIPADSEYIYVLDQGNKRVVVIDKKGEYHKQYLWDGLAGVTDMAVDEAGGSILALSGSQIYRVEIEVPGGQE